MARARPPEAGPSEHRRRDHDFRFRIRRPQHRFDAPRPPVPLVAGVAHGAVGLLLVSSVVGIAIANGIISRGVVKADAADVATLQAFAPLAAIFGVVGVAHVAAGLGIVFGSRTAAALGIGLGVLDLVAGVVILAFSAAAHDTSVDGTSFATSVVVGVLLAVAARAADWNTYGPVEA